MPCVVVHIVDANTRTYSVKYFKKNCMGRNSISSFAPEFPLDKIYRLKFQKKEAEKLCLLSCALDGTRFIKADIHCVSIVGINTDLLIQKYLFVYWRSLCFVIKGLPLLMNCHRQRNQNKIITEVSSHAPCYCHGCHRKGITLMAWVWNRISHEAPLSITFQTKEGYCPGYGIHRTKGI